MTEPAPAPITLPSATDVIHAQLRKDISQGVYPPGPIHLKPLAERFSVSVVPVREALRRLEAEGLVSFDGKRRIVINALNEQELDEIFAIRGELESLALRRAARRLSSDEYQLAKLEDMIQLMDAQEEDPDGWRDTNREFHASLYEAAEMPRLWSIVSSLWVASEPYLRIYVTAVDSLRSAQDQHRAILRQVRAGDAEHAEVTLREHLADTWQVVQQRIREEHQDGA
ncbi:MAG TPA: GntR family transcriptional regulator [Solirubrobacteraceae bacterium]|jgi:DNA-binding GntR family transcriptional regulator|nr:GntR family transcriptional regulator [Solirubrobacteraceae bacterium]